MPEKLITVMFEPGGAKVSAAAGATIKDIAVGAGVALEHPCGGLGTCGRCAVLATGDLEPPTDDERIMLGDARLAEGVRLSCRARVAGDVTVRPPADAHGAAAGFRIQETGEHCEIALEPPSARGIVGEPPLLGAVVDIGTTTLVVAIFDLETGECLGSKSALNPQLAMGHDVMSRIGHAAAHGPESLRAPMVSEVEGLIGDLLHVAGQPSTALREVAIAGNTTMLHLLLGIDPAPLGVAPYEPAFIDPVQRPAAEVGLAGIPEAVVYVLPGMSAFVGADITAGLLATGLAERETSALLIDLGTNGEMVLRTPDGLVASSTAAGPALEGASIAYGMRAEAGAIERVSVDEAGGLRYETIGGGPARGICGSGLLDLIAVLLDAGVLDPTGRLCIDAAHPLTARVSDSEGMRVFEVAPGVLLTQKDVRQVQLAIAAIASGIGILLEAADVAPESVEELIIAGGFGYHVKASALVRMGMIPALWGEKVTFAGNTAMTGALMALLDTSARRRAASIARHITVVDLAGAPGFQDRFVSAMRFPSTGV